MLKGCSPPSAGQPSAGQPSAGQPSAGQPSAGPRASHDNPRTPNVHISGPRRFKHHQNSTKGPPREGEKNDNCGGRVKKKARKCGPPTLRGPTLRGSTLRGSTLQGPTLQGPTLCCPKIQHPKIGRSRNWPKSKLAEVEIGRSRIGRTRKKKLAEVEIGRSRSRSRVWRSRRRADRGGSALRCGIQMTRQLCAFVHLRKEHHMPPMQLPNMSDPCPLRHRRLLDNLHAPPPFLYFRQREGRPRRVELFDKKVAVLVRARNSSTMLPSATRAPVSNNF